MLNETQGATLVVPPGKKCLYCGDPATHGKKCEKIIIWHCDEESCKKRASIELEATEKGMGK